MSCISKDSNECTLDNIQMLDGTDGNFGANFDLPKAIAADTSTIVQKLISMRFKGKLYLVDNGSNDLSDLDENFEDFTGNNTLGEDTGKNIPVDERPDDWPWEVLAPGKRRQRRLQNGTVTEDPDATTTAATSYI